MSTKSRLALGVLAIAGTFVFSDRSFACPDNQYNSCFLGACACLPKVGGDGARAFEHLKKEIPGQVGGAALDQWINPIPQQRYHWCDADTVRHQASIDRLGAAQFHPDCACAAPLASQPIFGSVEAAPS
jgi:hypothetical protein